MYRPTGGEKFTGFVKRIEQHERIVERLLNPDGRRAYLYGGGANALSAGTSA
jgi:hypothetical protein